MDTHINGYSKGMNQDLSTNKSDPQNYYSAVNMRQLTKSGLTGQTMHNVDGNSLSININSNYNILGSVVIRNLLVILAGTLEGTNYDEFTGLPVNPVDRIYVFTISPDGSLTNTRGIDGYIYQGFLGFVPYRYIKGLIGRYESDTIVKIYWIDPIVGIKFCNIFDPKLLTFSENQFNINPSLNIGMINFLGLGSGQLDSGLVQYHYQLYNLYGAQTGYVSSSLLIPLTASTYSSSDLNFKGTPQGTVSGKSVQLSFTGMDTTFNRMRIIRTLYTSLLTEPTIDIIAEIPNSSTVTFTDYGNQLVSSLTAEEFNTTNYSFIPTSLETKNNLLFASNIKENIWDVDYDARAYRFADDHDHIRSRIFRNNLYTDYRTVSLADISPGAINPVLPTENCINRYNDVTKDNPILKANEWKYKADGTTLGGQGPNVSYTFTFTTTVGTDDNALNPIVSSVTSYPNTGNVVNNKSYQRDEIYAFAIEIINTKGQWSTAKWIADIRFPRINEAFKIFDSRIVGTSVNIFGNSMGITFVVNNLPLDCVGYRILRCERKEEDKTIVSQGIGLPTLQSEYVTMPTIIPTTVKQAQDNKYSTGYPSLNNHATTQSIQKDLIQFISPEVTYNNGITYKGGDYLQLVGLLTMGTSFQRLNALSNFTLISNFNQVYGSNSIELILKYNYINSTIPWKIPIPIKTSVCVSPPTNREVNQNSILIDTYKYINNTLEATTSFLSNALTPIHPQGRHGTVQMLKLSTQDVGGGTVDYSTYFTPYYDGDNRKVPFYLYRRPVIGYGGNTYDARSRRTYIPCTDIIKVSSNSPSSVIVMNGDIFLCDFEYQRIMCLGLDPENVAGYGVTENTTEVIHFPVETTINLTFKTNPTYNNLINNPSVALMQENVGVYTKNKVTFTQNFKLYNYNSVYSRQNNIIKHYPKPLDSVVNPIYDNRIHVSGRKFNNEPIDSWTKWSQSDYKDIDGKYGSITSIINLNQDLIFFQNNAIGSLAVEDRVLLQTGNASALTLGTGSVMNRFDYITTTQGCIDSESIKIGKYSALFYDRENNSICNIDNKNVINVSKVSGIQSWLNNMQPSKNISRIITGFDPMYNEMVMTFKNSTNIYYDNSWEYNTICFNELTKTFTSFYKLNPNLYINTTSNLYSLLYTSPYNIWKHNSGPKGNFYGTVYPSSITIIINPDADKICRFDILHWLSQFGGSAENTLVFGEEPIPLTFTSITLNNSYQSSGLITLTPGTNVIRRFRTWRFNSIRDTVSRARFSDSFLKVTFEYNNVINKPLIIYDITTEYGSTAPR